MRFLVTGVAGFIGSQISKALLEEGHSVLGLDNLNAYYDVTYKQERLHQLERLPEFEFRKLDISDHDRLLALPERDSIDRVIHLAAQAGVRYSLENPFAYAASNMTGHLAVLEFCRRAAKAPMLVYASSSSVYGDDAVAPFKEDANVDRPVSLYAATKRADELMSQAYAKLYDLQQIGVRFFTVYGPWGRPDMAYWSFTDRILRGETIRVFNGGKMKRDFTYIDDAIAGLKAIATGEPHFADGERTHLLYNIGHNQPVQLMDFIRTIEKATGKTARIALEPMQPGDVTETCADISKMQADYGYDPKVSLEEGIGKFVDWFKTQRVASGPSRRYM
ncbi:NAD-dependent epimerase/dehydratase family protein [Henriciella mobilis]|uniref:NAD-dependent epimerase/dehydratase family protein n=1 Tax=Henriciella mobilis TaxID=2305467 RepID=A0A399R8S9_9PROT|nr:NAD-dependent epimerase/dehydratase family protein [Henriciella mobilis]RIJ15097.1 NAD-dependent epimerase/dehydratase family protein [Henriciella mobilis]RIJ20267.1 NAD-dependent epimerase/dehydratase family protein [Henriciella mobilis]RIJ27084.1 NAD-dependent epimerase/dehydratase family protein [Henriciella mobilis]